MALKYPLASQCRHLRFHFLNHLDPDGLLPLDFHQAHHVFGLKEKIDLATRLAGELASPLDIGCGGLDQRRGQSQPRSKLRIMIQHEVCLFADVHDR